MKNPFSVSGQNIFISGGTRGIGKAIGLQLAREGANVIANYVRHIEKAEEFEKQAEAESLSIKTLRADIASPKGVDTIVKTLANLEGALSGFIHCAATGVHRPFREVTLRHFDFTYSVNVRAFLELTQKLSALMTSGSYVLALSSVGAERAVDQYALTGSSKGALESLARHMAAELAPDGIRVNCLAPGTMQTEAWKVLPHSEERLEHAASQSPKGCLNSFDEVAQTAQFLCSSASSGIIGQTIIVDNGCRIME